ATAKATRSASSLTPWAIPSGLPWSTGGNPWPSPRSRAASSRCRRRSAHAPISGPRGPRHSVMSGYACATNRSSMRFSRRSRDEAADRHSGARALGRGASAADRKGDLRDGLLLVRRGSVREGTRGDPGGFGLYRRQGQEPELRAGLERPHRPCRGRAGDLRPLEGELREAPRHLLAQPRPDGDRPAVLRCGLAVPPRNLLLLRGAEAARRGFEGEVG